MNHQLLRKIGYTQTVRYFWPLWPFFLFLRKRFFFKFLENRTLPPNLRKKPEKRNDELLLSKVLENHRQTDIQTERQRNRDRQSNRQRDKHRDRQTDRQTERMRNRQIDRKTG